MIHALSPACSVTLHILFFLSFSCLCLVSSSPSSNVSKVTGPRTCLYYWGEVVENVCNSGSYNGRDLSQTQSGQQTMGRQKICSLTKNWQHSAKIKATGDIAWTSARTSTVPLMMHRNPIGFGHLCANPFLRSKRFHRDWKYLNRNNIWTLVFGHLVSCKIWHREFAINHWCVQTGNMKDDNF